MYVCLPTPSSQHCGYGCEREKMKQKYHMVLLGVQRTKVLQN